jgi:hypothetical protein
MEVKFWWMNLNKKKPFGRIILKWIFKKQTARLASVHTLRPFSGQF